MDNIRLVVSDLTGKAYLARFGKDPHVALEKRLAENDLLDAITKWMLHGTPRGASINYRDSQTGQAYELTLKLIGEPFSSSGSPTD